MLDWSQSDLAAKASLSQKAITNIELGITTPHASTISAIRTAFELNGVEFIGREGVRTKQNALEIFELEGPTALQRFYDDVIETMRDTGGHFYGFSLDEQQFKKYPKEVENYFQRAELYGITDRILLKKGDTVFLSPPECYRWIDSEYFGQLPLILYRDKAALIEWEPLRIVVIHSRAVAETFRRQFEALWAMATPVQV